MFYISFFMLSLYHIIVHNMVAKILKIKEIA